LSAKRGIDIAGAIVLLVSFLPLLLIIAALVRISSPGPVLFRQRRVGKHGRVFCMYKFRTMVANSDATIHQTYYRTLMRGHAKPMGGMFKLTHDPRVTSVGLILRRFSLDELPQLLNVLKGDMSLVGPRPPIPYEAELYGQRERLRLSVTPGLTGLWQVRGRNTLNFRQMVDLDIAYIEHWSLWLDLLILLRTPLVVITGRGTC